MSRLNIGIFCTALLIMTALFAFLQNLANPYVTPRTGSIDVTIAFLVIVAVLLVRPTGLLGHAVSRRV